MIQEVKPDGTPYKTPKRLRDNCLRYYHSERGQAHYREYRARPGVKTRRREQWATQPWALRDKKLLPKTYMRRLRITLPIIIVTERDGDGIHAYCPSLPGLHTEGLIINEAVANAKVAAQAYVQSLIKHGDPIPTSSRAANAKPHDEVKE